MNTSELVRFTSTSAVSHRLRSGLTALGIAIGVAAVVLLTSMGEGLRVYMVGQFTQFGTNQDFGSALATLLGGGVEFIEDRGFPLQAEMQRKQFTSYLARCERAGISRLHRTKLPLDVLGIDPATVLAN